MADIPQLSRPTALRLNLACDLAQVRGAAAVIRRFLAEQGYDQTELMDAELALVEACNNAIRYASPEGCRLPVGLEVLCDCSLLEMRVTDHTPGFDWPAKVSLPDATSERGRGLYLLKTLMDYSNYFRSPGENVLVLRKRRSSR